MKKCIMCGEQTKGSMDGGYICGRCDSGIRPDGRGFTYADACAYYKRVEEWYWAKQDNDLDREFEPIFRRITDAEEGGDTAGL